MKGLSLVSVGITVTVYFQNFSTKHLRGANYEVSALQIKINPNTSEYLSPSLVPQNGVPIKIKSCPCLHGFLGGLKRRLLLFATKNWLLEPLVHEIKHH